MQTTVHQVADRIHRMSTGFAFDQFLADAEESLPEHALPVG